MRKYSIETLVITAIARRYGPDEDQPEGARFVMLVSRMRNFQPLTALTESSAAAIGHSKQRRGWQRTVSNWIRPCAPRAPILPRGDLPATWRTARRVTALRLGAGRRSHCVDAASA